MTALAATNVAQRYRPLLELGCGRLSCTYLASSLASGVQKLVVLKLLHAELREDAHARTTFQREAAFAANLDHPNTPYVFEVVEHEGAPVIVMEYLEGIPLTRIESQAGNRLSLPIRLLIFSQVLAGLHHCHELRDFDDHPLHAIHGEIAPHNVIVLHEGGVKVVGFGVTQPTLAADDRTAPGAASGNLHYMPPEQLLGEAELDRRADVYAVGVMLWEAIARRPMWKGMDRGGVVHAFACGALPSLREAAPDTPKELQDVVARALSPNLETRYASAQALQIALEKAARETVGIAMPRELVDFMTERFEPERQARRQAIAHALQQPFAPTTAIRSSAWISDAPPWLRTAAIALVTVLLTGGVAWATRATLRVVGPRKRPHVLATQLPGEVAAARLVRSEDASALRSPADSAADTPEPPAEEEPVAPAPLFDEAEDAYGPSADDAEDAHRPSADAADDAHRPALDVDSSAAGRRAARRSRSHRRHSDGTKQTEQCNPPYRLTEDGLKSFKPECF